MPVILYLLEQLTSLWMVASDLLCMNERSFLSKNFQHHKENAMMVVNELHFTNISWLVKWQLDCGNDDSEENYWTDQQLQWCFITNSCQLWVFVCQRSNCETHEGFELCSRSSLMDYFHLFLSGLTVLTTNTHRTEQLYAELWHGCIVGCEHFKKRLSRRLLQQLWDEETRDAEKFRFDYM